VVVPIDGIPAAVEQVFSMLGRIELWARQNDPEMPRY
jgi:hypothetical protein